MQLQPQVISTALRNAFTRVSAAVFNFRKPLLIVAGILVVALGVVYLSLPSPRASAVRAGTTVEVEKDAAFQVAFDRPMNRRSVERSLAVIPAIEGTFSWQDNQLTFTPARPFEKGSSYTFKISRWALSIFFKPLAEPFEQTLTILDYPEVSVVAPADASTVDQEQVLTVLFDHPIRTLTGSLEVPELLQITPNVPGKYNWLGTSGFEFVPAAGWPAATEFTVTLPKGTKMLDGQETREDFTWKFATPRFTISLQSGAKQNNPKKPIAVRTNYVIDPVVLRSVITIREGSDIISNNQFTFTPDKDNPTIILIFKRGNFQLGKTYSLEVPAGFSGGLGPLGLASPWVVAVAMDERGFRWVAACPDDTESKDVGAAVVFVTNNQTDEDTFARGIQVTPTLEGLDVNSYGYSQDQRCRHDYKKGEQRAISISGKWKPSTEYTIRLSNELRDVYGQRLENGRTIKITTRAYKPSADLSSYSSTGVLAAHLPRLFQFRGMNLTKPITATLCSRSFDKPDSVSKSDCQDIGTKTYDPAGTLNEYKIVDIDLDEIAGQRLANGYYRLTIQVPELERENSSRPYAYRDLIITDTALTLKKDTGGRLLVWATDLVTGDVVPDLNIEVFGTREKWEKLAVGKTSRDGTAIFSDVAAASEVRAGGNGRFGVTGVGWSEGISTWNYGLDQSYAPTVNRNIGYIYTDRRIYRPDQKVFFKGVIRRDEDAILKLPEQHEVGVIIADPGGVVVSRQTLGVSDYGTFWGELQLESSMKLGTYRIFLDGSGDRYDGRQIEGAFDVLEYRRPDFKVEVTAPPGPVTSGDELIIPVHAEYFHGTPLSRGQVSYVVTRAKLYFQPMAGEWYSYSADDVFDCWWYCRAESDTENVKSGAAALDANGNFRITLPVNLTDYPASATYFVTATVTDVSNRSVSANLEIPVHKGDFYVGVRSDYSRGWGYPEAEFDVATVKPDGSPQPNVEATAKLFKRTWTTVRKVDVDGTTTRESEKTDELVETKTVFTDVLGQGHVSFSARQDGQYIVRVEARDSRGRVIAASANHYVYRGGEGTVRGTDDYLLNIVQNKASYEVGETAALVVQTPYAKTKALVTVERNFIREYHVVDLGTTNRVVEIPITDEAVPNVFVSVLAVQGGGQTGIPEFRMGYADLRVNTTRKVLNLSVKPDKDTYKPGDTVTLDVEAKRSDGSPAQAEVSIAVVDERVVALLGSVDKNILGKFWFQRSIGVNTAQTLTRLVKKVFFDTEGGAGGKGGDEGGRPAIRGNFQDTAYWKADVITGSDGRARATFTLPDNLTSWQILAIGNTKDTVVGSAEATIRTRRDLMVEPLFPRILRFDDTVTLGTTVHNNTDSGLTADVALAADGIEIRGAKTRKVTIAPRSRAVVEWTVHVPYGGSETKVTISAAGGGLSDGYETILPILPFSVIETVSTSGIFENNAKQSLEIPRGILDDAGEVSVSVTPNIGNGLQSAVRFLTEFPYECAEQRASRLIVNLVSEELIRLRVASAKPEETRKSREAVQAAIKILVATQRPDGGWGYWPESGATSAHLTAYVFWGLTQAEKAGFDVDGLVMRRADQYLREALSRPLIDRRYYSLSNTERAQVVFMLSERDTQGLSGYAESLYEKRNTLSSFGKAFLAMAFGNFEKNSLQTKSKTLLGDIRNSVVYLDPTRAYVKEGEGWETYWSSDLRSTSIYLMALLRLDSNNADVEKVLRYIIENRKDGHWATTNDTSMTLMSIIEYVRQNPIDKHPTDVSLLVDDVLRETLPFPEGDISGEQSRTIPIPELLPTGRDHDIGLKKDPAKRWFYDVTMKVFRQIEDIQPFENGFTLISDIYSLDDRKNEHPLREVRQGENVRIHMKLAVPKRRRDVALEYHLPAGLEAVDFQLKTSPQSLEGETRQCAPTWWGEERCFSDWQYSWWWERVWEHIEMRDDRVFLFAESLEPGVYEYEFIAMATTPGEFRVPPSRVYEFYNPVANAHNEGKVLRVIAQ